MVHAGEVQLLGHVRDEELPALYRLASALVYPSLYEGFGLPPLEAMACGCVAVVANTSALPEVCGDAGLYVDPLDVEALAAMVKIVEDTACVRATLRERGLRRVRLCRWEEAGRQYTYWTSERTIWTGRKYWFPCGQTDLLLTKYHLCGSINPYETVFSQEAVWMSSLRPKQGGLRVAVNQGNF